MNNLDFEFKYLCLKLYIAFYDAGSFMANAL